VIDGIVVLIHGILELSKTIQLRSHKVIQYLKSLVATDREDDIFTRLAKGFIK
jgi:hypothetical protein